MIIFGSSREYMKKTEPMYGSSCPHCNQNTLDNELLMRYFHVWYIPFFPLGKRVIIHCSHCKGAFDPNTCSPNIAEKSQQLRKETKYPLKYWFGLLAIIGVILLVVVLTALGKQ